MSNFGTTRGKRMLELLNLPMYESTKGLDEASRELAIKNNADCSNIQNTPRNSNTRIHQLKRVLFPVNAISIPEETSSADLQIEKSTQSAEKHEYNAKKNFCFFCKKNIQKLSDI